MPKKKLSYEAQLERLAEIVDAIDESETSLDTALALYKEGLQLAEKCAQSLAQYENEVLILEKDFTLVPFMQV